MGGAARALKGLIRFLSANYNISPLGQVLLCISMVSYKMQQFPVLES